MKVAVEIIDLVRVETRKQQDRDHVESFSLNDAQIQQLLLQGALSELKFKLLPADFFWAAWWGFDDLTGPGEEDSDVAVFLPVFTRLEAILKKKATHLDIRTERILDVPRTKVRHRREVHCKENFFAIYVSFPSQASLDSFVPVLEAVKLQSKSIWASPFLPREMRSNS
jgi:hypothetical protein